MKISAYISKNSPELREWLKSIGLTPVDYPDSDEPGLTAPYPNTNGEMIMYNDGVRSDIDDDYNEFEICYNEDEFKEYVLGTIKEHEGKLYKELIKDMVGEGVTKTVNRLNQILEYVSFGGLVDEDDSQEEMGPVDDNQGVDGGFQDFPDNNEMPDSQNQSMEGGQDMGNTAPDSGMMDGQSVDTMPNENGVDGFNPEVGDDSISSEESEDEEVIDVDDLTDSQESTEKKVDRMTGKFEKLFNRIEKLEKSIEKNSENLVSLQNDMEKRNPTPVEKLSLRSKDGYPFNISVDDYWKDKGMNSDNYSAEDDKNGEEDPVYTITKNDIDSEKNWKNISDSLDNDNMFMNLKDIMGF